MARQCLVAAIMHQLETESSTSTDRGLQQSRTPVLPVETTEGVKCEDLEKVVVDDDSEKFFQVRAQLPPQKNEELVEFLRRNINVFAQSAYEAPGVDLNFIFHHLNVNPSIISKRQPLRCKDHSDAVKDEVIKLKQAEAIKEEFYPKWLANIVVVKKKSGKW